MFYGDNTRWFIGKVAKVDGDPSQTGRIKVRIFGIHDDPSIIIPDDLPWAQVLMPLTEGGGSGIGAATGIQPQSMVFGIFLDGKESQMPLVLGSIITNENYAQELVEKGDTPSTRAGTGGIRYSGMTQAQWEAARDAGIRVTDARSPLSPNYQLTGSTNPEKAALWFLSEHGGGYTPAQMAGLIGNFMAESGKNLDPTAQNKTTEASVGIAQWNPLNKGDRDWVNPQSRLYQLIKHSESLGLNYLSLHAQLLWVTKELNTMRVAGKLRKETTPEGAADVICVYYEIPQGYKNPNSDTRIKRRNLARTFFDQFTSGSR